MIFESKKTQNLPSNRILEVAFTTIYLRIYIKDVTVNSLEKYFSNAFNNYPKDILKKGNTKKLIVTKKFKK